MRMALQVAATFGIAALSWTYIEDPIRHGALGRLWTRVRNRSTSVRELLSLREGLALAASLVVVVSAAVGLAGAGITEARPGDDELSIVESITAEPGSASNIEGTGADGAAASGGAGTPAGLPAGSAPEPTAAALGPCTSVVHVGGSTSLGLMSNTLLPDEAQRMPAQYARVGVEVQHYDIAGGRAIIEGYEDNPPARDSARQWRDEGYEGCWVFVLGTMDAATVARGGAPTGLDARIDIMMDIAGDDPVLWVNVKTITTSGPWRDEVMPPWNEALLDACERYDNLRVYDWASDVRDEWFDLDGVHQNGPGYVERARRIADALAAAFPGQGATAETPTAGTACSFDL
jgi:hypothetical protein